MTFPDTVRLLYIICAMTVVVGVILTCISLNRKTFRLKYYVMYPMLVGIFTITFYSIFLLCSDYKLAMFFESLFFIGTDWLAMLMMYFAIYYTEQDDKKTRHIKIFFAFLVIADTIALFINNFKSHMFTLIPLYGKFGIDEYWGNNFTIFHKAHLLLCYVMVSICLVCLIIAIIKSNTMYKPKYYTVLIAYIVVIIVNYICYTENFPIDASVVLYGVLGAFISYYTTTGFPKKLLDTSLLAVNDTISDAVIYFDYFGHCVYANKSAKQLFSNDGDFLPELTETYRERWAEQLYSSERRVTGTDSFSDNGKESYYEVVYQREYSKNAEVGASLKLYDKTEEVTRYERERDLAVHDNLTGILNRNGFFEIVDEYVKKYGTDGWIILSSNIRDFRLINEYFGEQRGDEVLKRQALICQTNSHRETVFARINDDRFAMYTRKQYFDEDYFLKYMNQMAELTDCPYYKMKVAVGVYDPKGKNESAQIMYDKALLASEYSGDEYNKVFSYYDSVLMGKIFNHRRLSDSVEDAILNNEIEMHLQPIFNKKGKCVGAEALSRWRSPHYGDMMPEQFINILEKSGKIYALDAYIWEQAAKLIQKWKVAGLTEHYVSVNISIKDFFYTDICERFKELIDKYSINPKNFRVEITETVLMSDFTKVHTLVETLHEAGIYVSIDNFGNGYSSLNMLKNFKADGIKIDMALLKNIEAEKRAQIILESVIEMTKQLDMYSVGNGVENKEQYNILKKCNCEFYQGNYLSPPISISEFEIKYNK